MHNTEDDGPILQCIYYDFDNTFDNCLNKHNIKAKEKDDDT